jgi:signal transduction histidine kinase
VDPNRASREECAAKCNAAAKLIQQVGLDAALEKINEPEGQFVWKDSYVFCFDTVEYRLLAHRVHRLIGIPVKNFKSADGRPIFQKMVEIAKKEGSGWITYDYVRPGEEKPSPKTTYFIKVSGEDVIIGAGYYQ